MTPLTELAIADVAAAGSADRAADDARCEALFASGLQRSDALTADAVTEAISRAVREFGPSGCASQMAQEFGDHPEAASERMQWARSLVADAPLAPPPSM
jgi:hypothetical protein